MVKTADQTKPHANASGGLESEFVFTGMRDDIVELSQSASSTEGFYRQLFRRAVARYQPLAAMIQAGFPASSISDEYFRSDLPQRDDALRMVLESFLDDVQEAAGAIVRHTDSGDSSCTLIAVPLFASDASAEQGAIVLIVDRDSDANLRSLAAELSANMAMADAVRQRLTGNGREHGRNLTLDAISRSAKYESTRELAYAFVNQLCERFDAEQIGFGIVDGKRVEPVAISGIASFKKSSPGVMDLRHVMEECLDFGQPMVAQQEGQPQGDREFSIHRQWAHATRSAVCSIPLCVDQQIVAVVSVRRSQNKPFSDAEVAQVVAIVEPFGQAIRLLRRSERSLTQHLRQSSSSAAKGLTNPRTKRTRLILAATLAMLAWFFFGTMAYRPSCRCQVVPANITHFLAPFDMKLEAAHVQAGDEVAAGQLLATFDTRELDLEKSQLDAEVQKANVEVRQAITQGDVAAAALARARVGLLQTKLDTVQDRIRRCSIYAAQAGMVMEAELDKSIGQIFTQGGPILTFAPMDDWELEIQIPERSASHFQPKQSGCFAANSHPHEKIPFRIDQISGSAQVVNGTNAFRAVAKINDPRPWLRMGIEGVAKTDTGRRPVWWVACHRLIESAQLSFWF